VSTLPANVLCLTCGHIVKWHEEYSEPDEMDKALGFDPPYSRQHWDMVDRPCPHRNGTILQFCPKCDDQVSIYGCGPAGGMECQCWDQPTPIGG
jgi:hypothetical protein